MLIKEVDRLVMLMEEIAILKSRLQPHDTGHIHTTINTLESRVEEIRNSLVDSGETKW
tara:strand:- start:228 stop:401 length:174 start_codon:yes stop_codon:yes gene_type:complete